MDGARAESVPLDADRKIPLRGEAALEAVTTLAVLMGCLRRLTSASRGERAFAVVPALAAPGVCLRGMDT
jgi:hypothetical protein